MMLPRICDKICRFFVSTTTAILRGQTLCENLVNQTFTWLGWKSLWTKCSSVDYRQMHQKNEFSNKYLKTERKSLKTSWKNAQKSSSISPKSQEFHRKSTVLKKSKKNQYLLCKKEFVFKKYRQCSEVEWRRWKLILIEKNCELKLKIGRKWPFKAKKVNSTKSRIVFLGLRPALRECEVTNISWKPSHLTNC